MITEVLTSTLSLSNPTRVEVRKMNVEHIATSAKVATHSRGIDEPENSALGLFDRIGPSQSIRLHLAFI